MRLRLIKSEEEIDWLRIGAALSDAGFAALLAGHAAGPDRARAGRSVESAYVGHGGTTMIHYIGVTSMAKPHIYVPPQHPSPRKVQKGDVVFCELSAYWWDYPGQVLRTFTVGAEPTPLYRDLHDDGGGGVRRRHRGRAPRRDDAGDHRRRRRDRGRAASPSATT